MPVQPGLITPVKSEIIERATEITARSAAFGLALLMDVIGDDLKKNPCLHAQELSVLLKKFGPSFIKIGQSIPICIDLSSPA